MTSMPAPPRPRPELGAPSAAATLRAVAAMARMGAANALAAPTALASRALFFLLVMVVIGRLWGLVAAERVATGLVNELPAQGLLLYVGVTEWIALSVPAIHLHLEDDFRRGALESRLLQPPSPLLLRLGEAVGGMGARMAVIGSAGIAAMLLSGQAMPTLAAWPWLLALGLLGGMIGVLLQAMVGLSSAWLRSSTPIFLTVQKACFLFGGLLAPVTLYPHALEVASKWSPFGAHLYWVGAIAIASPDALPALTAKALSFQLAWLALLGVLTAVLWRRALGQVLREGLS